MKRLDCKIKWLVVLGIFGFSGQSQENEDRMKQQEKENSEVMKLFLCGDVMTGRGIDQALPHSVDPVLYESYVKDARDYLRLAETANGNIDVPVSYDYIWGDALEVWKENAPDFKLINLETSITTHDEPWPGKGINYRMHPENVKVLTAAGIDHCSLANNHTLDWGRPGLTETMRTLNSAGIKFSGLGENEEEAGEPSVFHLENRKLLIFSYGSPSSGVPPIWEAEPDVSGVNMIFNLNERTVNEIKKHVESMKKVGDVVVFSVHWGPNWGYDIPERHREFAHQIIDEAGVDIVFGHSSHHPLGIEVYNEKLIIYGAGDFINDYEGISGHEEYRGELTLMYFPEIGEEGRLKSLKLVPLEIKNFQLNRTGSKDAQWLEQMLDREGAKLGTAVHRDEHNVLWLEW